MSFSKQPYLLADTPTFTFTHTNIVRQQQPRARNTPHRCINEDACTENWAMYIECPPPHPPHCTNCNIQRQTETPHTIEQDDTGKGTKYTYNGTTSLPPGSHIGAMTGEIISQHQFNRRYSKRTPDTPFYTLSLENGYYNGMRCE